MKKISLLILILTFTACTNSVPIEKKKVSCLQVSDETEIKAFLHKLSISIDENKTEQVLQYLKTKNNADAYGILRDELSSESYGFYLKNKHDAYDMYKMSFVRDKPDNGCYTYQLIHNVDHPTDSTYESNTWIYLKKDSQGIYISTVDLAG